MESGRSAEGSGGEFDVFWSVGRGGSLFEDRGWPTTGRWNGWGSCGSYESRFEALNGNGVRTGTYLKGKIGRMALEYFVGAVITGSKGRSFHVFSD